MNAITSNLNEIPETLREPLQEYLERNPDWDMSRVLTAAVSLFLLQNGDEDRSVSRTYLNALFSKNSLGVLGSAE